MVKVMTHPWTMDKNCVNYCLYPTFEILYRSVKGLEVTGWTKCEQTDRHIDEHTDKVIPIYPQLCLQDRQMGLFLYTLFSGV